MSQALIQASQGMAEKLEELQKEMQADKALSMTIEKAYLDGKK